MWLKRCLATFLGFLLVLTAAELMLRALRIQDALRQHFRPGIYAAHAERGWTLQANYRGLDVRPGAEVSVSTNEFGFRGHSWTAADRAAALRVLMLGDSCTFGFGVAEAETLPAALEAGLRARQGSASVFNAGVPGYDTRQQAALLRQLGPQLRPNLVIVNWLPNDVLQRSVDLIGQLRVHEGYLVWDENEYREWRASVDNAGPRRSALYRFVSARLKQLRLRRAAGELNLERQRVDPEDLRYGEAALADIHAQTEALGARMLLVLFPRRSDLHDPSASGANYEGIAEFARQRGIQTVPLLQLWQAAGLPRPPGSPQDWYLSQDQIHFNSGGYAEIARSVLAALTPH